jgi:hypothetical protein
MSTISITGEADTHGHCSSDEATAEAERGRPITGFGRNNDEAAVGKATKAGSGLGVEVGPPVRLGPGDRAHVR